MNRTLKRILIIVIALGLVGYAGYRINLWQTKSHSPEDTVTFSRDDLNLEVFYNRPYKKGREIFGGLVPYGEVWRTGANEATTFTTNKTLIIDGKKLPAGKYTLWTIPGEQQWQVIFNSKMYPWGIDRHGKASRDPKYDVISVTAPVRVLPSVVEQFTISIDDNDGLKLIFEWDQTQVAVALE